VSVCICTWLFLPIFLFSHGNNTSKYLPGLLPSKTSTPSSPFFAMPVVVATIPVGYPYPTARTSTTFHDLHELIGVLRYAGGGSHGTSYMLTHPYPAASATDWLAEMIPRRERSGIPTLSHPARASMAKNIVLGSVGTGYECLFSWSIRTRLGIDLTQECGPGTWVSGVWDAS
jgi:hypothetical protein